MSLYFEKSAKTTYSKNQQAYAGQSIRVVGKIRELISTEKDGDLYPLFEKIVDYLGEKRQEIALAHRTAEAEKFGLRRDLHWIESYTSLSERYYAYGAKLEDRVHQYFLEAQQMQHPWPKEPFKKDLALCLQRNSSVEMIFIGKDSQEAIFPTRTIDHVRHIYRLCECELPERFIREGEIYFKRLDALEELALDTKAMKLLAEKSPLDYQKLRNTLTILCAQRRDGIAASTNWVLLNHYFEMDHQIRLISQNLFRCAPSEGGLQFFDPTTIHQDPFLLRQALLDMALVFKQAVAWNKSSDSRESLKEILALLIYLWAHATPFLRGSAATGEWLERAIYEHHRFAYEYNNKKTANLEALTLPLKEFVDVYPSTITLFDLDDPQDDPTIESDEPWSEEEEIENLSP